MSQLRIADDFTLDTGRFDDEGLRIGIFASPGAGKGYTLGVLLEELIETGYPCVMVDAESELWTFREIGALVVGGPHGHAPLPLDEPRVVEESLRFCLETATPVVFDMGEFDVDADVRKAFDLVARAYWRLISDARRPSVFAVTEAHVIAPQTVPRGEAAGTMLATIVSRGRKRGATTLIETQRMAEIANAVISHCNVRFIGRIDYEDDFKRVAKGMPGVTVDEVRDLERGSFYVPRLHDGPIRVRERRVTHGAVTPGAGEIKLRRAAKEPTAIARLAEQLNALVASDEAEVEPATKRERGAREGAKDLARAEQAAAEAAERARVAEGRARDADELEEKLRMAQQEITDRDAALDAIQQRLDAAQNAVETVAALRAALTALLGDVSIASTAPGGPGYPGDEHVIDLVRQHAPAGAGAPTLKPVEALRADYLERTAQRLVERIRGLEPDEREALLFLVGQGVFVTRNAVAKALGGSDSGGVRERWGKALVALKSKGLIVEGGSGKMGRKADVEAWVRSELGPNAPTDQEIADVRDRALSVLHEGGGR